LTARTGSSAAGGLEQPAKTAATSAAATGSEWATETIDTAMNHLEN
jgi:hypothetical protein